MAIAHEQKYSGFTYIFDIGGSYESVVELYGGKVDRVGKDGIKSVDGTITHIDRAGKTMAVKTGDGTEDTFKLSGHAAADAGKEIAKGAEKTTKITVYYTEEAGKKTAHFFEKI